jgi:hypothetical protein
MPRRRSKSCIKGQNVHLIDSTVNSQELEKLSESSDKASDTVTKTPFEKQNDITVDTEE